MYGALGTQTLEHLPQRPPTPPRESGNSDQLVVAQGLPASSPLLVQDLLLNTPTSSADSTKRPLEKKKVEWSPWPDYREPPKTSSSSGTPSRRVLTPLPHSSNKPIKSILKPYHALRELEPTFGPSKLSPPHRYANFASMLESIVKQLAGSDRNSRIDAYLTLNGVLKASDLIPDLEALRSKIGLITEFIQRDIAVKNSAGSSDSVITIHALMLLASLLYKTETSELLGPAFSAAILEHAIAAFESSVVPKEVVRHLMFIVAQQNFFQRIMTPDRAGRFLRVLQDIESRVKGRSIVHGRLNIYRKLITQSKASLLVNTAWIEHIFTDMLSSYKDTRDWAITCGLDAARVFGTESKISRTVMELFKSEWEEGKTWMDHYQNKLTELINKKDDAACVPRIWSVLVLFLRSKPRQLEQWESMRPWIRILSPCFNSSEYEVRKQANFAWNKFTYAVGHNGNTSLAMIKTIVQPMLNQWKRSSKGRNAKVARKNTIGSTCNLFYYALSPVGSSFAHLDKYWDEYVAPLIKDMLEPQGVDNPEIKKELEVQACAILEALLYNPKAQIWSDERVYEDKVMRPEDLHAIDAKWIRLNSKRIFRLIEPLIEKTLGDLDNETSPLLSLWQALTVSIASAGSKEIKVSYETMAFMALLFNLLCKLWQNYEKTVATENFDVVFLRSFSKLICTTIDNIGVLPFVDKQLSLNNTAIFEVVSTPSHRPSKLAGDVRLPLHHLIILLAHPPANLIKMDYSCSWYQVVANAIIEPFFKARQGKSKWSRIELAKDLGQLIVADISSTAPQVLWNLFASYSAAALGQADEGSNGSSGSHGQPLGAEYRNVNKILEIGIKLSPLSPLSNWKTLFNAVSKLIVSEAGESAKALMIIEPLAVILSTQSTNTSNTSAVYCTTLLDGTSYPKDRRTLDAASRRLWGPGQPNARPGSFDPFKYLYTLITRQLIHRYQIATISMDVSAALLESIKSLLLRSPVELISYGLLQIQDGLVPWAIDEDAKLGPRGNSQLASIISDLWAAVCSIIKKMAPFDDVRLHSLETILCSGFQSRHKSIVTQTVTLWNSTFGSQDKINYPSRLESALRSLEHQADIHLPSPLSSVADEASRTPITFLDDSQNSESLHYEAPLASESVESIHHIGSLSLPRLRSSPHRFIEASSSTSKKRSSDVTPESGRRKAAKTNLTPRFKHNDSQIQFAAIESSPLANVCLDSEILTERQKEVKERQQAEAGLFPDLPSTSNLKPNFPNAKPAITSDLQGSKGVESDVPSTPDTTTRHKDDLDNFITSSPTPRRGANRNDFTNEATDPPSSPPERADMIRTPFGLSVPGYVVEEGIPMELWNPTSPLSDKNPAFIESQVGTVDPSAQVVSFDAVDSVDYVDSTEESSLKNADQKEAAPHLRSSTPVVGLEMTLTEQHTPKTPAEVFVDARQSPSSPSSPRQATESDPLYVDAVSIREQPGVVQELIDEAAAVQVQSPRSSAYVSSFLGEMDEKSVQRLMKQYDVSLSVLSPGPEGSEMQNEGEEGTVEGNLRLEPPAEIYTAKATQASKRSARLSGRLQKMSELALAQENRDSSVVSTSRRRGRPRKQTSTSSPAQPDVNVTRNVNLAEMLVGSTSVNGSNGDAEDSILVPLSDEVESWGQLHGETGVLDQSKTVTGAGMDYEAQNMSTVAGSQDFDMEAIQNSLNDEIKSDPSVAPSSPLMWSSSLHQQNSQLIPEQDMDGIIEEKDAQDSDLQQRVRYESAETSSSAIELDTRGDQQAAESEAVSKPTVMAQFEELLSAVNSTTLSREEAEKMEAMWWDFKHAVSGAVIRGRK